MTPVSRWVDGSRAVAGIVAVCQAIKDDLVRQGLPAAKIDVVYSGTDTDWFDPARASGAGVRQELGLHPDTPLVTQIGVREPKGNDDLLRAFARIRAARPDARLLLVGARPEKRAPLEALARAGGLGDAVTIWGYRDDVPDVLAASQVSVDASYEGLGVTGTLRESLAMETPVVATRAMGNPELVGHEAARAPRPCPGPRRAGGGRCFAFSRIRPGRGASDRPAACVSWRASRRGPRSSSSSACTRAWLAPVPVRADRSARGPPGPPPAGGRLTSMRAATRARESRRRARAAATIRARNRRERLQAPPSVRPPLLVLARRRGSPGHRGLRRRRPHRLARQARHGRDLHPARSDDAEAPPARHPRRLRRQGHWAVRPVLHDGLRRRAGDHGSPARPLRAHPGHAAGVLPGPALGRPHVPRRGRCQPSGPPVVRGPGHGVPAGLHRGRAPCRHADAGDPAHAPRPGRLPTGRAHDPVHGSTALLDQPPDAGADRRAEHGAPGGAGRHQDRQGLRSRGARAGPVRPGQSPAARAVAEGPPGGRAVGAHHGDPRGPRADGHPLVRGLPGDPGRHDARHALLLRDGHADALRSRAQALADREPRPADHPLRRADLRDPLPPAGGGGRAGRAHPGRLPSGDRVRPRLVPLRGR